MAINVGDHGIITPIKSQTINSTATYSLDMELSNLHSFTLSYSGATLSPTNVHVGQKFLVRLTQDATGSRTLNWWSGISWPGNISPYLTTTANKTDVFGFICTASGSYDGFVIAYNL